MIDTSICNFFNFLLFSQGICCTFFCFRNSKARHGFLYKLLLLFIIANFTLKVQMLGIKSTKGTNVVNISNTDLKMCRYIRLPIKNMRKFSHKNDFLSKVDHIRETFKLRH